MDDEFGFAEIHAPLRNTDSAINMVMMYTINTGSPETNGRIQDCSLRKRTRNDTGLLAALNNREALWEKCFGNGVVASGSHSASTRNIPGQDSIVMVNIERAVHAPEYSYAKENGNKV
ncbi:hypothetical protein H0H92_015502 [Tricholoma furcatifolium]|nr:hypothetical protein H0H92_015502 [Tricholoma furcatifolium]